MIIIWWFTEFRPRMVTDFLLYSIVYLLKCIKGARCEIQFIQDFSTKHSRGYRLDIGSDITYHNQQQKHHSMLTVTSPKL